jgi:DNA-binding YbaB/EbfC family protein
MFGNILGNLQGLQADVKAKRDELSRKTYPGEAADGKVTALVSGTRKVIALTIDPSLRETLPQAEVEAAIMTAINTAYMAMETEMKAELGAMMKDKLPSIPGLDLGGLLASL